jgi:hypothetical protein
MIYVFSCAHRSKGEKKIEWLAYCVDEQHLPPAIVGGTTLRPWTLKEVLSLNDLKERHSPVTVDTILIHFREQGWYVRPHTVNITRDPELPDLPPKPQRAWISDFLFPVFYVAAPLMILFAVLAEKMRLPDFLAIFVFLLPLAAALWWLFPQGNLQRRKEKIEREYRDALAGYEEERLKREWLTGAPPKE